MKQDQSLEPDKTEKGEGQKSDNENTEELKTNNIDNSQNKKKTTENSHDEESFDANVTLKETSGNQIMNTSDEDRAIMPPPPTGLLNADDSEEFTPGEGKIVFFSYIPYVL